MKRNLWILIFGIVSLVVLRGQQVSAEPAQQTIPTATAVQVSLPTPLPLLPTDPQGSVNSVSITRTPTPESAAQLEALTEANVRSQPDPDSDRLGTIRAGDTYTIIGRYYKWFEFQYDQSPSGTGWVFDELVKISGNEDRIPDLTLGTPTPDANALESSSTLVVLTQTPGGVLTATAGVGILPLPIESSSQGNTVQNNAIQDSPSPLPTYTSPPNIGPNPTVNQSLDGSPVANPTASNLQSIDVAVPSKIPPILPILVLGGAGILGLIISSLRK